MKSVSIVMNNLYARLREFGKVKINEPMSRHTTFKIGGPAAFFVVLSDVSRAPDLLCSIDEEGVPRMVLGGGSNMLFQDEPYEGVVIKITDTRFSIDGTLLKAAAGAIIKDVSAATVAAGLTGFEWAIGVPGTIAGALRGNAAYNGIAMQDCVEKVEVYRDGEVLELYRAQCDFAYKESIFKRNNDVILNITLALKKGSPETIQKQAIDNIQYRKSSQPDKKLGSAGCTFKNVVVDEKEKERLRAIIQDERVLDIMDKYSKVPAGRLIDMLGLKGSKKGSAQISDVHANFIVNLGGATAADVKYLVELVKEKVYNAYGIALEEEVHVV